MNEGEARQRIRTAYRRLAQSQGLIYETDVGDQTVTYHVNAIRNASGGVWNETIASDYVANLESQLEEEIVAGGGMDGGDEDDDGIHQESDRSM